MANINSNIYYLAQKYYGTRELSQLKPYQLDKLAQWSTGLKPDQGKNKDRKAGRIKGRYLKGKI